MVPLCFLLHVVPEHDPNLTVLPHLEHHCRNQMKLADMPLYPEYSRMPLYLAEKVITLYSRYFTDCGITVVLPHKYPH